MKILKEVAKFKSDYHKLCELKDMRIEQLEKNIKLLGERCNQLLADKGKLTDEYKELEAQIEKMKSALIDIKSNTDDVNIKWQIKYLFDELEIKEND